MLCLSQSYDCDDPIRPIDQACCRPSMGLNRAQCEATQLDCSDPDALDEVLRDCCVLPVDLRATFERPRTSARSAGVRARYPGAPRRTLLGLVCA